MKVLIRNLINSALFILLASPLLAQYQGKKYIRKNDKAETIFYGDSSIYARGLYSDSTRIFIGNSNGAMYYYNTVKSTNKLVFKLPDFDEMRDIEFSEGHLIGMHSGTNGKLVLLELNGSMKIVQIPEWKGVFLDGVDFLGKRGFMMGDPVDTTFSLFHSNDGGYNWTPCEGKIKAFKGEAAFAASGTTVQVLNDSTYVFVSGGEKSRFFKSTNNGQTWSNVVLPYYPGASIGPYSMCFANDSSAVMVGGNYLDATLSQNACFYTYDGGESWLNAMTPVRGYRSCVYFVNDIYYACGTNGIDFSLNGGEDWIPFANGSFFSLSSAKDKLIATTKHGSIMLFDLIENDSKK